MNSIIDDVVVIAIFLFAGIICLILRHKLNANLVSLIVSELTCIIKILGACCAIILFYCNEHSLINNAACMQLYTSCTRLVDSLLSLMVFILVCLWYSQIEKTNE